MIQCGLYFPCSDGIGESKKPPCVSCHDSGSQCVLVESRRGGNFRSSRPGQGAARSSNYAISTPDKAHGASDVPSIWEHDNVTPSTYDSVMGDDDQTTDSLRMELRNPSDALQILAHSSDASSKGPSSRYWRQRGHNSPANSPTTSSMPGSSSPINNTTTASHIGQDRDYSRPPTTALDNYDLVQRGLLHPSVLPELLHMSDICIH